jgi:catechol 2,3-dioxygenase-like lactoylglutathione lyase family enzyme
MMTEMAAPMRTMLAVNDLGDTVAFYVGVLGFSLEGTWGRAPGPSTWCALDYGPGALMFTQRGADEGDRPTMSGSLYFYPRSVDRYYETLIERGAHPLRAPVDKEWGMREFAIKDPDGYLLLFGEPIGSIADIGVEPD